ncbi:MAG: tol-pal system protein YbgF [Candidatus Cloacimonetes bacterium]|mgnify:FL=1|nr:tol-pal system protein YbgF [Candidatus Cloacimonadota bacterium]HOA29240.1 tol-pal system protein YbgF [Candidatus Cloacimonadota bacterium]HOH59924.1 tol-pal system protein YbgF [Candidatus Cloacimonadota bacterium]HPI25235.1 tol-pal system protein YbgF [Candidatus Cloacimonadota bacterium]
MKRLLLLALIPLLIFGCVSNKAFREEKARIDKIESALAQNNTELGVLRKEIMQDRRGGAGSSKEEIEALVTVIREMSDDQMKQNALMQEDIAFLMDKMSQNPVIDASGTATSTDPQMVNRMNALADNLEKSSIDLNQKIAAMQKDINALKAGSLSAASAAAGSREVAALQAQIEAQRKAQEAELEALRKELAARDSAGESLKPVVAGSSDANSERDEYEKARMEYNQGNYDKALQKLDAFVARYPKSEYAGNAHYWKGESLYAKGEMADALKEFEKVVTAYPDSWKVADSQLKIGMCQMNMGNNSEARSALNKLKRDFPYYGRMDLVNIYLEQMNQ